MVKPLDELIYHLDLPNVSTQIGWQTLTIKGWVAHPPPERLAEISVATTTGKQVLALRDRPDVRMTLPKLSSTGFESTIDPKSLTKPVTISFLFEDGTLEERLLNFKVPEDSLDDFDRRKAAKLKKILEILRCPACSGTIDARGAGDAIVCKTCDASYARGAEALDFLSEDLRARANIFAVDAVSSNEYDPATLELIARYRTGLILDNGSGLRSTYYDNVVNFDVVGYKTTDVLGIGESLPFRDSSFDAIISIAVLEHVRNPFDAASEIERVLKPGGEVYIAVPFLQPFHGYPDHYYNMTANGLRNLFPHLSEMRTGIPRSGLPIWALSWILNAWSAGLPEGERERFTSLSVSELMADPVAQLGKPYVTALSEAANRQLACVNVLRAVKPRE